MATNSPRLLSLATLLLSGLLLGLPWSLGGKSPVGQAVVVLIPILAGALGVFNSFRMMRLPDPAPSETAEGMALG